MLFSKLDFFVYCIKSLKIIVNYLSYSKLNLHFRASNNPNLSKWRELHTDYIGTY